MNSKELILSNIKKINFTYKNMDFYNNAADGMIERMEKNDDLTLRDLEMAAGILKIPVSYLFDLNLNDVRIEKAITLQDCIWQIAMLDIDRIKEIIVLLKTFYGVQKLYN